MAFVCWWDGMKIRCSKCKTEVCLTVPDGYRRDATLLSERLIIECRNPKCRQKLGIWKPKVTKATSEKKSPQPEPDFKSAFSFKKLIGELEEIIFPHKKK